MCICTPAVRTLFCDKCKDLFQKGLVKGATTKREKQLAEEMIKNSEEIDKEQRPKIDLVVEAVRKDLLDRSNVGIKKYGTTLDSNRGNLRYWLNNAYEECLDQANYLKRAIMELDANGN